jgi:hypothetical protein
LLGGTVDLVRRRGYHTQTFFHHLNIGKYHASRGHSAFHNTLPSFFKARRCRYHIENAVVAGQFSRVRQLPALMASLWDLADSRLSRYCSNSKTHLFPTKQWQNAARCKKVKPWHVSASRETSGICELEEQCYAGNSLVAAKTPRQYPIIPRAPRTRDLPTSPRPSILYCSC